MLLLSLEKVNILQNKQTKTTTTTTESEYIFIHLFTLLIEISVR